jgi:hypothetical protein
MHCYLISGLHVSSELELPGAIPEDSRAKAADVAIRRGLVPVALQGATETGPTWEMAGEAILLRVPRLARFLITAGREISVEIEAGAKEYDATGFVLGSAFGILLHQRGALVLHGAAVAKGNRAIAICGPSGVGKSTLAAALCREGLLFATDDICVVGFDGDDRPVVLPDGRKLKLWEKSIEHLDLADRRGEHVRGKFEKYFIDSFNIVAEPPRLSAIYVIRETRLVAKTEIEGLSLPDAMRTLDYEAYRRRIRAKIGQKPEMVAQAAAMLKHARLFLLKRASGFEHLQETVAAMRAHWDALDQ